MFSSLVKKPVIKNVIVALKNLLVTPRYKTGSIDVSNALSRNVSVNVAVSNAVQRKSAGVVAVRMDETVCFFFQKQAIKRGPFVLMDTFVRRLLYIPNFHTLGNVQSL